MTFEENLKKLYYILIVNKIYIINQGIGIFCCMARVDFNLIGCFVLLMVINQFYNKSPMLIQKINFQGNILMILIDIIWLIIMSFVWNHSQDKKNKIKYWSSIKFIHNIVYYLVFVEIVIKCYIIYFIYSFHKKTYSNTSYLTNLNYNPDSKDITSSTRLADTTYRSQK